MDYDEILSVINFVKIEEDFEEFQTSHSTGKGMLNLEDVKSFLEKEIKDCDEMDFVTAEGIIECLNVALEEIEVKGLVAVRDYDDLSSLIGAAIDSYCLG